MVPNLISPLVFSAARCRCFPFPLSSRWIFRIPSKAVLPELLSKTEATLNIRVKPPRSSVLRNRDITRGK